MTTPPPEPAPPASAPVDERVTRIEREQERQGGVLDRIVSILGDTPSDTTVTRADAPASVADMGEQMRQAVRDVRAEEAAASSTQDKTPPPETTPREVMIRGKERLQRALFGGDPKK